MPPRHQLLSTRLPTPQLLFRTSPAAQRSYATEAAPPPAVENPLQRKRGGDLGNHLPRFVIPSRAYIPPYPYGNHPLFKQADRGLYGDQMIQFGNNVSDDTETKTRRDWKPNVLSKGLFSVTLNKKIKLRVTAKVLKMIDREGGLDEYLLKDSEQRVKELGPLGWALRWTLLLQPSVLARVRSQAAELGLKQATINAQWPTPKMLAATHRRNSSRLVRAAGLIGEDNDVATKPTVPRAAAAVEPDASEHYTRQERRVMQAARKEYEKVVRAAHRYVTRGLVDTEEDGFKLAFVRADEREAASIKLKEKFSKKLDEMFTAQDLADTRAKFNLPATVTDEALRKISFNQWRRRQVEQAGSYEAWLANVKAQKTTASSARIEALGGQQAFEASRKAMYAKLLEDAENASTNDDMNPERRRYLETALRKAEKAMRAKAAGGVDAYVELVLDELHSAQLSGSAGGAGVSPAVLDSGSAVNETRPSA